MADPTPAPASSPQPSPAVAKKPRSPMERLVVWGAIGLLLLVGVCEVMAQRSYLATVKKFEELERTAFSEQNPRTATVATTAEGWYSQTPVADAKRKTVRLKWPSLFKQYILDVEVDSKDRVLSFVTVGDESLVEPMKQGPKPTVAPSFSTPDQKPEASTPDASSETPKAKESDAQPEKAEPEKTDAEEPKTDK